MAHESNDNSNNDILDDDTTLSHLLELPVEIKNLIIEYLDKRGKAALFSANFGLFRTYKALLEVSDYVVNGNENIANIILRHEKPENAVESSILEKKDLTDPGGRTFKKTSPLQYAYWMGDWYMVDMLLKNLPKEYLAEAQKQINEIKGYDSEGNPDLENQKGIEYQLYLDIDASVEEKDFAVQHLAPVILPQKNVTYNISLPPENYDYINAPGIPEGKRRVLVTVKGEQHYSYQPLIKALKDYLPIYQQWQESRFTDNNPREKVIRHWCKIVGLVQRYATAFLAQQYCHPARSFEHVKFDEQIFNRSLNLFNFTTDQTISWFFRTRDLDISSAVQTGGACRAQDVDRCMWMNEECGWPRSILVAVDLTAVDQLCKVSPEKMASVLDKYFASPSQTMRQQ